MASNRRASLRRGGIPAHGRSLGVTLTELMIVIVILGILAAVAYPNYREFSARAKRSEAKAALLQVATNQERFYLSHSTYSNDLTDLGFASNPFITETGSYRIRIRAGANSAGYVAEADYLLGGSEADKCVTFTIDSNGIKASDPYTDCWTRTR